MRKRKAPSIDLTETVRQVVYDAECDNWYEIEDVRETICVDQEEEEEEEEDYSSNGHSDGNRTTGTTGMTHWRRPRRQAHQQQRLDYSVQSGVVDLTFSDEEVERETQQAQQKIKDDKPLVRPQQTVVAQPSSPTPATQESRSPRRKKSRKELSRSNPADLAALVNQHVQQLHHPPEPLKSTIQHATALAHDVTQLYDVRSCFTRLVKDQDALDAKLEANSKEMDAVTYRFTSIVHEIATTLDEDKLQARDLVKNTLVESLKQRRTLLMDWDRLQTQKQQIKDLVASVYEGSNSVTSRVPFDARIPETVESMYVEWVNKLLDDCLLTSASWQVHPQSHHSAQHDQSQLPAGWQTECAVVRDQATQMKSMMQNYLAGLWQTLETSANNGDHNDNVKERLHQTQQQLEQLKREEELAERVRKHQREQSVVQAEISATQRLLCDVEEDLKWANDPNDVRALSAKKTQLQSSVKALQNKLHRADGLVEENRSILAENFPELLANATKDLVLNGSFLWETGLVDGLLHLEEYQLVKVVVPKRVFIMVDRDGQQCVVKKVLGRQAVEKQVERLHGLAHPTIVPITRVFLDKQDPDTTCYVQMPHYEQGDLRTFVARMKTQVDTTGSFDEAALVDVQGIFGQLAQALAHIHAKGIAHRNLQPESILMTKHGRIALCGFSKSSLTGEWVSNSAPSLLEETSDYVAPEGIKYRKKCDPALDMWSFGCMMLELLLPVFPKTFGKKFGRDTRLGQVAAQEIEWSLLMNSFPSPWMKGYVRICSQLLRKKPEERLSASELLHEDIFKPRLMQRPDCIDLVVRALFAIQPTSATFKQVRVPGTKDAKGLCRHCFGKFDSESDDFNGPIKFVNGRGQAQDTGDVMNSFFNEVVLPRRGLFTQSLDTNPAVINRNESTRADRAYLPTPTGDPKHFRIVGMMIGQCMLQGTRIPLLLNSCCIDFMLGRRDPSNSVDECLAFLNETSDSDETLYRNVLRERQNNAAFPVEMGVLMGTQSEQFVTDENKSAVICEAIWTKLVENRRKSLEYLTEGFGKLRLAAQLQHVSSKSLQRLFFGSDFVPVNLLTKSLRFMRETWPSAKVMNQTQKWLLEWIDVVSDVTLRILLARCFHSFQFDSAKLAQTRLLVVASKDEQVHFPDPGVLQLPSDCVSFESLDARLRNKLVLVALKSDEETVRQLSQAELSKVVGAMNGDVRPGAWFRCPNGHLYAVGNCGGVLETRKCPSCNATIGGLNYRIAAGNTHANVDGAIAPPYPGHV